MPILKTHAIPLYYVDVFNTSRIVTWLTSRYGKLSTILKGEQRKNSLFRGQYALFSTSELVFYDREEKDLYIAKECSLLYPRNAFRFNWRACASAGYISALFAKTTLRRGHEKGLFAFFEEMLSYAETHGDQLAFLIWFDLKFAEFQGQAVRLDGENRRSKNQTQKTVHRFSGEHGGVIEPSHAREHQIPAVLLASEAMAILRVWQRASTPPNDQSAHPAHLRQIERALGKFIAWQFSLPPHVRKTAVKTLCDASIRHFNRSRL